MSAVCVILEPTIVTSNVKDFLSHALASCDVVAQHMDELLLQVSGLSPPTLPRVVEEKVGALGSPAVPARERRGRLDAIGRGGLVTDVVRRTCPTRQAAR